MNPGIMRKAAAEGVGTAMLLAAVVGSGIMGERLAGGNVAIALLANTVATGAALVARSRRWQQTLSSVRVGARADEKPDRLPCIR